MLFLCLIAFVCASVLHAQQPAQWTWERVDPRLQNRILRSVDMASVAHAVAVADGGVVRVTRDSGKTWSVQRVATRANLHVTRFLDSTTIIAAGEHGVMFRSTDGGATWSAVNTGLTDTLLALSVKDPGTAFVAGASGAAAMTSDSGLTWSTVSIPGNATVQDIEHDAAGAMLAVSATGDILRSADDGATWALLHSVPVRLRSIHALGSRSWIAIGDPWTAVRSTDDGATWTSSLIDSAAMELYSRAVMTISGFFDADTGVVAFYHFYDPLFGQMYRTTDAGRSWNRVEDPEANKWIAPSATSLVTRSGVVGQAVGNSFAGRSTDAGLTWSDVYTATNTTYRDLAFADSVHGIILAEDYANNFTRQLTIDRTTDGGETWMSVPVHPATMPQFRRVAYPHPSLAVAVADSGLIFRSTDRGATWSTIASGTTVPLMSVAFSDTLNGAIVGGGTVVLRTRDGGTSWLRIDPPTFEEFFEQVDMPSDSILYVRGTSLYVSRDAGATWTTVNLPTTSRLSAFELDQPRRGWAAGGDMIPGHPLRFSVDAIYYTDDGGSQWQRAAVTMRDTGLPLFAIAFGDRTTGLAVGTPGRVLQSIDVGMSWTQLPNPYPPNTHSVLIAAEFATPRVAFVMGNLGDLLRYQLDGDVPTTAAPEPGGRTAQWRVSVAADGIVGVTFSLNERLPVDVGLFDLSGRLVRSVISGRTLEPGAHSIRLNVDDLATGVYVVRLKTGAQVFGVPISLTR